MVSRVLFALSITCAPLMAEAQRLEPGTIVRVRTLDAVHKGALVRADGGVIVLHTTRDSALVIESAVVQRVHVLGAIPAGRRVLKGAGVGMLVGMVAGALVLSAIPNDDCADDCGTAWFFGGIYGAGAGLMIGGIWGAWHPKGWRRVPFPIHGAP